MLATLLVLSIPVVGGAFLYSELRWGKFMNKSVLYGLLYALAVFGALLIDAETRFMRRSVDSWLDDKDTMILQYVAKRSVADESMKLDVLHLEKSLKCKVVDAKLEGSCLCNDEVWVVIKYHSPSKSPPVVLKSSPSLKSISRKRRSPELRARRNY